MPLPENVLRHGYLPIYFCDDGSDARERGSCDENFHGTIFIPRDRASAATVLL